MQALVSIHDVMPETLDRVEGLIQSIPSTARPGLILLVVPGRDWRPHQLARLAGWQQQGLELAGHGWHHRAREIRGLYHWWHARLMSRQAAEHLSLDRQTLRQLLVNNHRWFAQHNLRPPELYVPPAWALGALRHRDLTDSPFSYFETTTGIVDACGTRHSGVRKRHLPLVGFEADTAGRRLSLRLWNRVNRSLASERRPLRVSLHPYDAELCMAEDLAQMLGSLRGCLNYRTLFE